MRFIIRILLKITGELFNYENIFKNKSVVSEFLNYFFLNIKILHEKNYEICVVLGGGNLVRGRDNLKINRTIFDNLGILNSIINSIYFKYYLNFFKLSSLICNSFNIEKKFFFFPSSLINNYLKNGKIIIFSGGLGIPYFSTDTTAAYRGIELNVDYIIKLTKVDGVFNKDPNVNSDAKVYSFIRYLDIISNNIKILDKTYLSLCLENNKKTFITNINKIENVLLFLENKKSLGTLIF